MINVNTGTMDILEQIQKGQVSVREGAQIIKRLKQSSTAGLEQHNRVKESGIPGEIAVIGISGKFPGAGDIDKYWANLAAGVDAVTEILPERWDIKSFFSPDPQAPNKTYCKWGGFLPGIDMFDPFFFNISPREAELMDPQQRLFLEECWKALEDAGYAHTAPDRKKCGVFVGCALGDYQDYLAEKKVPPEAYSYMGNSSAILAGRISYFLNLRGPSITIDTACSSSLVSIHLACESISQGTIEMALAGGVAIQTTPKFHILAGKSLMLSPAGKCKTFDNSADGFVPGEGVGVVVLKSLENARRDRDHIYAVIKGSGLNQDGKTNGITAPSATSQTALECEVYDRHHINPETIGYVETHGTGTKLGDPIEIQALTSAFRKYTDKTQFCPIGSVKTNIGHALAAAGIAGFIKLMLCFTHKKLVPSLHFKQENEHINFNDSPFYVNTGLKDWPPPTGVPRRAAISTFGFSGTNAHIVLEEWHNTQNSESGSPGSVSEEPQIIILSAKNEQRLKDCAGNMLDFLGNTSARLVDIAYTLQVGRESMEERLALLASNIDQLKEKLNRYLNPQKQPQIDNCYWGRAGTKTTGTGLLVDGEEGKAYVRSLIQGQKLAKLARLWVSGVEIDWQLLSSPHLPCRISLPTYPFERERYWVTAPADNYAELPREQLKGPGLHILIDSNESTLEKICFKKTFTGKEFFIKDHGNMLPGVVYLEMVRAAGDLAYSRAKVRKFKNVIWANPVMVKGDGKAIYTNLYRNKTRDSIEFEITTGAKDNQKITHSRGMFQYGSQDTKPTSQTTPFIEIQAVLKRCQGGKHAAHDFYKHLGKNGSHLGPRFKGIREFYFNEKEALARVEIEEELENSFHEYLLHPTLTDSGIQTAVAFGYQSIFESELIYLPYVLGELEIIDDSAPVSYVYVQLAGNQHREMGGERLNALLLDKKGRILVKMNELSLRPISQNLQRLIEHKQVSEETVYYRYTRVKSGSRIEKLPTMPTGTGSHLKNKDLQIEDMGNVLVFDTSRGLRGLPADKPGVVLVKPGKKFTCKGDHVYEVNPESGTDYDRLAESLEQRGWRPDKILHCWSYEPVSPKEKILNTQLERGVYSLFHINRSFISQKPGKAIRVLFVFPGIGENTRCGNAAYAAISGFARSVSHESGQLIYKIIETPADENSPNSETISPEEIIRHESTDAAAHDFEIRYEGKIRQVRLLQEVNLSGSTGELKKTGNDSPIRENGVYMITGGTGSLGLLLAEYLAQKVKARLVLTDLAEPGAGKKEKIKELERQSSGLLYIKADISKQPDVDELVKKARSHFGTINGIIHCAGLTRDSSIQQKTREEFQAVLAPKVYGTVNLDEATRAEKLDFFVLFSSLSAVLGSPGQCDYGYANSFLDHFAHWRDRLRANGERSGKTISINWPLWKDGGMKMDARIQTMLFNTMGIGVLNKENGIKAFETALAQPASQLVVLTGNPGKIRQSFQSPDHPMTDTGTKQLQTAAESQQQDSHTPIPAEIHHAEQKFQTDMLDISANLLKIPGSKIELHANIGKYGFDSINFTELSRQLNAQYNIDTTPDLFFGHSSIGSIASFLFETYKDTISRFYREPLQETQQLQQTVLPERDQNWDADETDLFAAAPVDWFSPDRSLEPLEPVAIIGIGGVMPQSRDLETFWRNLLEGKNLITEIPENRWDWKEFYGNPEKEPDKTRIKWGGFMQDAEKFDSLFFNISPREAAIMDPQLRIFMETVWQTIEDAGYRASDLSGTNTGVFAGVSTLDYKKLLDLVHKSGGEQFHFVVANRISYFFNLHGPSEAIDTACSSSLVAVHRAVEAIQTRTCEMVIAGGVNLIADPGLFLMQAKSGMLSEDGRCYSFDKRANGYVRGEGSGAILLKSLKKAKADGDHIYAVIRGSGVNHGGHASSFSTPNPVIQAELLTDVYEKAGIPPATVSYIEAHGTATSLGDPIEINGLKKAFEQLYQKQDKSAPTTPHCGVGSVKTNIGHLEAAAGIAGILKVLLSMKYRTIPGNINFQEMNPLIKLQDSPFFLVTKNIPWENLRDERGDKIPRLAGVSSFGIGGTNAHIILEEYHQPVSQQDSPHTFPGYEQDNKPHIIVLSAKNEERLKAYAQKFADFLDTKDKEKSLPGMTEIACTLQVGREPMAERLAMVVTDKEELKEKLHGYCRGESDIKDFYTGNIKKQAAGVLAEDEEGESFVRSILQKGKPEKIARLWVSGVDIDWRLLYPGNIPQRASLPTYPFAGKRYWLPEAPQPACVDSPFPEKAPRIEAGKDIPDHFFFIPDWQPVSLAQSPTESEEFDKQKKTETGKKTVLVIYPQHCLGIEIALTAAHSKDEVIEIKLGARTKQYSKRHWEVEVPAPLALDRVIGKMKVIHTIYFLGGIVIKEIEADNPDQWEQVQQQGVLSLFRLMKALNRHELSRWPIQLKVVTNDVHRVLPGETTRPYSAALHGLTRTIAREYPHFETRCLDIDLKDIPTESALSGEKLQDLIKFILGAAGINQSVDIAIRSGREYVRTIKPALLPPAHRNPFKPNGVYLILGGAGRIGMELSLYLAGTVQARLILVGRKKLHQDLEQKIDRIEARGGKAVYIQADAVDLQSMKRAVDKGKSLLKVNRINGVFHSAVAVNNKALENMDEETFCSGLAPKVKGSLVLNRVIRMQEEPLDFMLFFSSCQSFIGEAGLSNYVAGNTFEDAFAHYLDRISSFPVRTLNLGYWQTPGDDPDGDAGKRVTALGLKSFGTEEGIEAVKRILANRVVQVIPLRAGTRLQKSMGIDTENPVEIYPAHTPSIFSKATDPEKQAVIAPEIWLKLEQGHNRLKKMSHCLLLAAFQQMGVFRQANETYDKEHLKQQLKIIPGYSRLYYVLLDILAKAGLIRFNNNGCQVVTTDELEKPEWQNQSTGLEDEKKHLLTAFPEITAGINLLLICLEKYPEILSGIIPATDVMFPNSSMELMEGLYKGNVESDYYNSLAVQGLVSHIRARLPYLKENEKINILEIGAGTGGTSALVFDAVRGFQDKLHYVYTDISMAFTRYGKDRYGEANPFAVFKVLDIEKRVTEQGFNPGDFDVIIAANVVHATRSIRKTLTNIKLLLKTNGWIILNEGTKIGDYGTMMFGLLEGWWLFEDEENRHPGCPLLSTGTWERILKEEGFERVAILGKPTAKGISARQHVFIAESNGQVKPETEKIREAAVKLPPPPQPAAVKVIEKNPGEFVRENIIDTLAVVLQMESQEFDPDIPYTDVGVDSILAIEIANRINKKLGINLRSTDLFNYATIKKLTDHILRKFGDSIRYQPDNEVEAGSLEISGEPGQEQYQQVREGDKRDTGSQDTAIAVIGISSRFPDAANVDEFWKNLAAGKNSIRETIRWDIDSFYDPDPEAADKSYCKWGGILQDIDAFDPLFFNISPKEAEMMDPQQRLFLQEAFKALEDAGYADRELEEKKCGVFVGINGSDYFKIIEENGLLPDAYQMTGNYEAMLSARISYFLNLRGPAVTINTACSSSLTAVHLACESIRSGISEMVIAGGVTILTTPQTYILLSRTGVLSHGDQCRAFDNRADGIVLGEGVGAVVLKSLESALNDRDHIYGIILGSGINQDGKSNGITAPNAPSQTALECEIYDRYNIDPETISYIETHGTGTRLGDPIEIDALTDAFRKYTLKKQYCAIGSVKTNIGHSAASAGTAGLIKTLLCLKYKKLVPSLHFETTNEFINFKDSPFYVNTHLQDWQAPDGKPRVAAVSSFGFSGTNAHLVVRETDSTKNIKKINSANNSKPFYMIPFSAKTEAALNRKLQDMAAWLENHGKGCPLRDISYTLLQGRSHYSFCSVFIVRDIDELEEKTRAALAGEHIDDYLTHTMQEIQGTSGPKTQHEPARQQMGNSVIKELQQHRLTGNDYKKKLLELADFYIKGYDLDWQELYGEEECRRISLPTYPFADEKYWVPEPGRQEESQENQVDNEIIELMQKLEKGEITLTEANNRLVMPTLL